MHTYSVRHEFALIVFTRFQANASASETDLRNELYVDCAPGLTNVGSEVDWTFYEILGGFSSLRIPVTKEGG